MSQLPNYLLPAHDPYGSTASSTNPSLYVTSGDNRAAHESEAGTASDRPSVNNAFPRPLLHVNPDQQGGSLRGQEGTLPHSLPASSLYEHGRPVVSDFEANPWPATATDQGKTRLTMANPDLSTKQWNELRPQLIDMWCSKRVTTMKLAQDLRAQGYDVT